MHNGYTNESTYIAQFELRSDKATYDKIMTLIGKGRLDISKVFDQYLKKHHNQAFLDQINSDELFHEWVSIFKEVK